MSIIQDRTKKYVGIVTTSSNAGGTVTIPINGTVTNGGGGYYWYDPNYQFLTGTQVGSSSFGPIEVIPGTNIPVSGKKIKYKVKKDGILTMFDWIIKKKMIQDGEIETD